MRPEQRSHDRHGLLSKQEQAISPKENLPLNLTRQSKTCWELGVQFPKTCWRRMSLTDCRVVLMAPAASSGFPCWDVPAVPRVTPDARHTIIGALTNVNA